MGENGNPGKVDIPSKGGTHTHTDRHKTTVQHKHTCGETMAHKGRQGVIRPQEGGHTIQQRETRKDTIGTPNTKADTLRSIKNGIGGPIAGNFSVTVTTAPLPPWLVHKRFGRGLNPNIGGHISNAGSIGTPS